jgi:response regulator RpfG family c-di-GMP phosphodiesterase
MHTPLDDAAPEGWTGAALQPATTRVTILCVDDEPNVVSALGRVFQRERYRVLTATSSGAALEILGRETADVVLSDMRMPGMDGAAFLEEVSLRWPRTARILLTGYNDLRSAVAAINRGEIFRYLFKPWDDDEMRLTVRQALERQETEDERRRRHEMAQRRAARLVVTNDTLEDRVAERTEELRAAVRDRTAAYAALDAAYVTTIRLFASLAETGIDPNRGHGCRVADHAQRMALALGFELRGARAVLFAGLLHDIGQLALPRALRSKAEGRLTPEEAAQARRHCVIGEAMLMGLPPLREAARLIRHHHERFDGGGYPDGLKGEDIPLGARIIMLASDFDALCGGSIFGEPMPEADAAKFLAEHRGTRYDPRCVDAFFAVTGRDPAEGLPIPRPGPADRRLRPADLGPGMRLAADLVTDSGIVLLTRDHVLDQALIDQLRTFEREAGWMLDLPIGPGEGEA